MLGYEREREKVGLHPVGCAKAALDPGLALKPDVPHPTVGRLEQVIDFALHSGGI